MPLGGQGRVGCGRALCHVLPAGPTCGAGREGAAIRSSIVALGLAAQCSIKRQSQLGSVGCRGDLGEGETGSDR